MDDESKYCDKSMHVLGQNTHWEGNRRHLLKPE